MAKKLYIIDGHAHIYAAYFAPMGGQLTSPSGEPTKATYIFTMALLGLIQRRSPDMLVVALDSKAPTFRSDIYAEYKANRPPMPDDLPGQIDRIEQILGAMNIPIFRVDGFEADDIIGTLAKRASADGYDCLICSKDKDLLQLIDEHISTFDIKTDTRTDVAATVEKIGVTPEQFVDCLALQGDTADNVPGIPGVGEFNATKWIRQYGSLDNLYAHAHELKGKRADSLSLSLSTAMSPSKSITAIWRQRNSTKPNSPKSLLSLVLVACSRSWAYSIPETRFPTLVEHPASRIQHPPRRLVTTISL
jgi:DNA polymerase-1